MKLVLMGLIIFSLNGWAKTESQCEVIDGFYNNSDVAIQNIKLETFVDIFSLNNAKTLSIEYAGKEVRFQRTDIDIKRYTKMIVSRFMWNEPS